MKLGLSDISKRLSIKFDKSITADNVRGFMRFGENNDYPQKVERIINSSITAKSVANIYAKFLTGSGFEEDINNVVVGKDSRGKDVTILRLLRHISTQISIHSGFYVHTNMTLEGKVTDVRPLPFKNCRFAEFDDLGYCSKVGVYDNWEKDPDNKKNGKTFDKTKIRWYHTFNNNDNVLASQIKELGGIEKHKGQLYFGFIDDQYLYPLSPFDSVLMDCDTENQVSIYKNNLTRNGMTDKTIIRVVEPSNKEEEEELANQVRNWQGSEGDNVLVLYDEIDPDSGELKTNGAFKVDSIPSSINDKLFEGWQKELSNNIRKAVKALPSILIDYEENKLGTTSGEAIIQAVNFYNSMTRDERSYLSECFNELFKKTAIKGLESVTNWNIKELRLYELDNIPEAAGN